MFTNEIGRPLNPPTVSAAFKRAVKSSGLPPLTLHGLRHTFATISLDRGWTCSTSPRCWATPPPRSPGRVQHVRRDRLNAAMAQITEAIEG